MRGKGELKMNKILFENWGATSPFFISKRLINMIK